MEPHLDQKLRFIFMMNGPDFIMKCRDFIMNGRDFITTGRYCQDER